MNFDPYTVSFTTENTPPGIPLDPRKRDHDDYGWAELRRICHEHGGWSFIREGRGGVLVTTDSPFFRFEHDDSCPDPEMAATLFKESAGKRLAELGVDYEIDIDNVARTGSWDVTVSFSVRLCENGDDEYSLEGSSLCENCTALEREHNERAASDDGLGFLSIYRGGK